MLPHPGRIPRKKMEITVTSRLFLDGLADKKVDTAILIVIAREHPVEAQYTRGS